MNKMNSSSLELNNLLTKDVKKEYGIFFTPTTIVQDFYPKMKSYLPKLSKYDFLEPSCGSCEFIDILQKDSFFYKKNIILMRLNIMKQYLITLFK